MNVTASSRLKTQKLTVGPMFPAPGGGPQVMDHGRPTMAHLAKDVLPRPSHCPHAEITSHVDLKAVAWRFDPTEGNRGHADR